MTNEDILAQLALVLEERKTQDPQKSYVASLYAKGLDSILKKIGEEATETVIAAKDGDPAKIVSTTTRVTTDPVGLQIAKYAAQVIEASGKLKDGFSFQTGSGGISLAVVPLMVRAGLTMVLTPAFCAEVFAGTMIFCLAASAVSFRKISSMDPALVFRR